jgi:hypothetical protein
MDDPNTTTGAPDEAEEDILTDTVADETLESAADTAEGYHLTLAITFSPNILACC